MATKKRLDISMETDFLQSFVRGSLSAEQTEKTEESADAAKRRESHKPSVGEVEISKDELTVGKTSRRCSKQVKIVDPNSPKHSNVCSKFLAEAKKEKEKHKKRLKRRTIKSEELYTDKDRAAAVNLGTRDIKQSLKLKRQQDRSKALHIPEEADPAQFLALGYYEMKKHEIKIALNFINKALELNANEKNALVARSKCYILLGQPEKGLEDAEAALEIDKKFLKAIYLKAEALYNLGDFEHSLMYYHRGLHIRADNEEFKLGVEKAQKAIETALGVGHQPKRHYRSKSAAPSLISTSESTKLQNDSNNNLSTEKAEIKNSRREEHKESSKTSTRRPRSRARISNTKLLKDLAVDKEYLESLLTNPNLQYAKTKETNKVLEYVQETVEYLNKREEFWRQQVPPKR